MEQQSSRVLQKEVNVVVSKAPIMNPIYETVDSGKSLRSIYESHSGLSEQHTSIYVNGELTSDWEYATKDGDCVSICQVPGWEYVAYAVISFAIGAIIGYVLYKSIDQPTTEQGETLERITGAKNEAKPYEPIPFILGSRRVVPSYAAQPYTYWKGDEQWLKMLLCVGYGPLSISDIKIGDNPITKYDDVDYEVLDWNTTTNTSGIRSIWNADIQQDSVNQELGRYNYISRAAPPETSEITFSLVYPQGLWRTDDGDTGHSVGGIQFRFYSSESNKWYSVARIIYVNSNNTPRGVPHQSLVKFEGEYFIAQGTGGSGAVSTLNGKFDNVTDQVVIERDGYAYLEADASGFYKYVNSQAYWEATRDQIVKQWSWKPIDPVSGNSLTGNVPFEIKRNGWDYDPNGSAFGTTLQLSSITYTLNNDVGDSYFGVDYQNDRYPVLIALDIRATEQLSGIVDNLSCQAQSLVPFYKTPDWSKYAFPFQGGTWTSSNNPADLYRYVLQGPFNGARVSNEKIDLDSVNSWYTECASRGWECNEIVNYETNLKDLLNNIAFTGRAFFSMNEGKFGVIENKEKSNPVQVFTAKNSRDLKSHREFKLETDGIRYTFANGDFQDQEDEGYFGDPDKYYNFDVSRPKPGANITRRFEDMEVWGTTNPDLARKHARFAYFEDKLRREAYTLETDIEALVARRGDKVLIANDIIGVGLGQGFVTGVDGGNVRIDETINLQSGQTYAATFRSVSTGTVFSTSQGTYNGDGWWTFPVLSTDVSVGDLVSYGEPDLETLECLITEITYGDDYTATLTLANYASDLYNLDSVYLPEYQTGLTPERKRDITPSAPSITVNYGDFSYQSNSIGVDVSKASDDRSDLNYFKLQYRYVPQVEEEDVGVAPTWLDGGTSTASSGKFNIPVATNQGSRILVRAAAVNMAGVYSPWTEEKEIVLQNDPSPDVESITITEEVDKPKTPDARWSTITIEIEPPTITGSYLYAIAEYRQPGQEEFQTIGRLGWKDPNKTSVEVFADGRQYEFRVRSVSIFGLVNKNGVSEIVTTTNTDDPEYTEDNPFEKLPAPNVKGLELFEQGNDTEFGGRDAKFTWKKSTLTNWIDLGYEGLKGASSAELDQYFRDYQVDIIANNEVVRTENVTDNFYTYTYEKNAEDYERRYGTIGAYREFRVSVIMRTRQNQESEKPALLDVSNTAPAALQNVVVNPGFNVIEISYQRPDDLDFAGVDIWIETTQGFDPDTTTPFATISDNSFVASGLQQDTTYYVRLRPFDDFGKTGTNTTSEFVIKTKTGQDLTGLSGWAYEIDPVNRTFIQNNIEGGAIDLGDPVVGGQLGTAKLADLSVEAAKLADGSVDLSGSKITGQLAGVNLADAAVDTSKLVNLSVESAKLAGSSVTSTKIANLAVGTAAIANAAITNAKIANLAVDTAQIADAAIQTVKIGDAQITDAKIVDLTAAKITTGTVNATETITAEGVIRAVDDINTPQQQVGIGPAVFNSTTYLLWSYNGTDVKFGVDELGNVRLAGDITGSNGTFSGTLSSVDGTFTGTLSGVDGDFSGSLSAATGTFAGTLSGVDGTFSGELSAATGTFGGTLSAGSVESSTITGSTITGSTLQTASSGRRVVIDSATNNIEIFNSGGSKILSTGETVTVLGTPYDPIFYIDDEIDPAIITYSRDSYGVFGESRFLTGVYGASLSGTGAEGNSTDGNGVSGTSETARGVFGLSQDDSGVYGTSTNSYGVEGFSDSASSFDFYASGSGTNYGPFTGAHDGLLPKDAQPEQGDILAATGQFEKSNLSNTIPYLEAPKVNSRAVYGVFVGSSDLTDKRPAALKPMPDDDYTTLQTTHKRAIVNALGEGQINVCGENGDIEVGDFICTSNMVGKGMRYDGQDMRYVVAKAMENVIWSEEESNVKQVACIYMCG